MKLWWPPPQIDDRVTVCDFRGGLDHEVERWRVASVTPRLTPPGSMIQRMTQAYDGLRPMTTHPAYSDARATLGDRA